MIAEALRDWAQQIDLHVDDEGWARLETLAQLWRRYAAAFNLVGDSTDPALIEYVREGLMAVEAVERSLEPDATWRWLDIGSGAGIPGLVVGAVRARRLRLVEPREKRAAFLDMCMRSVCRGEGDVVRARAVGSTWNDIAAGGVFRGSKGENLVTSAKAVFSPAEWLAMALPRVSPRGRVVVHVAETTTDIAGRRPLTVRGHAGRAVAVLAGEDPGSDDA